MLIILDVDKTLLTKNISFLFGRELRRRNILSFSQTCRAVLSYGLYQMHLISQEKLHTLLFTHLFFGISKESLQKLFRVFFAERQGALVRLKLLDSLRSQADATLMLFSSSPDWIVEEVGRALSIPLTVGSEYRVDSKGHFCELGMVMTGKNKAVRAIAELQKNPMPLAVYTDSADDIPLMNIANFPVAVYPDRRLFRYAQKKGWAIIDSKCMEKI